MKTEDYILDSNQEIAPLLDDDEDAEATAVQMMHETNAYKELKRGTMWYADKIKTVPGLAVRGSTEKLYFAAIVEKHYMAPPPPAPLNPPPAPSSISPLPHSSSSLPSSSSSTIESRAPKERQQRKGNKKRGAASSFDDNIHWSNMAREWNRFIEENPGSGL